MIDKRIFYCWFGGGEMTDLNKKCMATWKKYCPDYEIIEINESNFDYHSTPYAEEAYEHGNWSYVSNAARLEFLKHNSGFYLDTDVQLIKSLDEFRKYDNGFITEFDTSQPDSGVLGCAKWPKFYDEVYNRLVPGTVLHKEFIQVMYRDYDVYGKKEVIGDDGFAVIGEEYFPSVRTKLVTPNTIGIHHFENTWVKQWRNITDGFYPYQKIIAKVGNKLVHKDEDATVNVLIKNFALRWDTPHVISRMNYFFNPRVVKLSCREFDAERIEFDHTKPTKTLVTPLGMIVTYIE